MEQNPVTPDDTTTSLFVTMEGMMHAVHAQFYFSPTSSPELRTQAFANYLQSERDLYSGARSVPDQLIYHVDFPHSVVVPPLEQFELIFMIWQQTIQLPTCWSASTNKEFQNDASVSAKWRGGRKIKRGEHI